MLRNRLVPPATPRSRARALAHRHGNGGQLPSEVEADGYVLSRRILGRPVGPAERDLLNRVNTAILDTRRYFSAGRANVSPDIDLAAFNTWQRKCAVNIVLDTLVERGFGLNLAMQAGITAYFKGGACREYRNVAAHAFSKLLKGQEFIVLRENDDHDHCWCVVVDPVNKLRTVLDPWCEGVAISADDSQYERKQGTRDILTIEASGAWASATDFEHGYTTLAREMEPAVCSVLRTLEQSGIRLPAEHVWKPEPVLAQRFGQAVREQSTAFAAPAPRTGIGRTRVHRGPVSQAVATMGNIFLTRQEIDATGLARDRGATSVREITALAHSILASARNPRVPDRQASED